MMITRVLNIHPETSSPFNTRTLAEYEGEDAAVPKKISAFPKNLSVMARKKYEAHKQGRTTPGKSPHYQMLSREYFTQDFYKLPEIILKS